MIPQLPRDHNARGPCCGEGCEAVILPKWMRVAMLATAAMNCLGAFAFVPSITALRNQFGFPQNVHPLYLWIIAEFIFIFGVAYAWAGFSGRASRLFVAVGAAGKLAFFGTIAAFALSGELPFKTILNASGDLIFGLLFAFWIFQTRNQLGK